MSGFGAKEAEKDKMSVITEEQREVLAQLIRIGIESKPEFGFKKIPRQRVQLANINKVFGVNADYLKDGYGDYIWPDDWIIKCVGAPATYYIVEKEEEVELVDPEEDIHYSGESMVVIEEVPDVLTKSDLRCWLRCGLSAEDVAMKRNAAKIAKLEASLKITERRLEMVPFMNTQSADFKKAAEERKRTTIYLNDTRTKTEEKIADLKNKAQRMMKGMNRQPIELREQSHEEKLGIKVWLVGFRGPNADVLGHRACHKKDWHEVQLCRGYYPKKDDPRYTGEDMRVPSFAIQGDLPSEDYETGKVNMRRVAVRRFMHGKGTFVYGAGDVYKGEWHLGNAHGAGKSFQVFANYEGGHYKGHKQGSGKFTFCNGDTYEGEVGCESQHEPARIEGREYCFGLPHGRGTYTFADGSRHEGTFVNGQMTGPGKYTGSDGEIVEGNFRRGLLHGPGPNKRITARGAKFEGEFFNGQMHHKATWRNPRRGLERYIGDWWRGRMHGRGQYTFKNGDNYYGNFYNNMRQGRGVMEYGNVVTRVDHKTGKEVTKFDYRYEGEWRVGKTRARGSHTDQRHRREDRTAASAITGISFTTNGKSKRYPRLYALPIQEAHQKRKDRKEIEEFLDQKEDTREHLERKHLKAFRKHRHYAKKAIQRQLENLANQKLALEERLKEEVLAFKRKQREQELREQKFGGEVVGPADDGLNEEDKMFRGQRRVSAGAALEGIEREQVDELMND